ncbi:MAG: efflux RND transporter periplasmic adaptor subunit [Longimicrobiales bacterium]|nr:efflux RND transporter periplasmic adaptor subunit [Longimicrobiales bacterium]
MRRVLPALLVLAAACGGQAPAAEPDDRDNQPVPVGTDTVTLGRIARTITIPGTVEAIRTIGVNAQVAGALLELNVEEGDRVEEGAVLARLDDRELQAQLRAAEAQLQVSESAYERAIQLRDLSVITQAEFEVDRTAFEAARAQAEQLRTRVGYTVIRAPLGGVVTTREVQAGDILAGQSRLVEIAEIDTMVVRVSVSELDVVEISPGDPVSVRLDAIPGQEIEARVRRVFPSADPATRLVPVEVMLDGVDPRRVRPGFLARVTFELAPRENATLVPAGAIVSRGGTEGVYVVAESTVVFRSITPGLTSGDRAEVLQGLDPGERVVVAGSNLLRDGGRIRDMTTERASRAENGGDSSTAPVPGNE